jgi:hypothetical protein
LHGMRMGVAKVQNRMEPKHGGLGFCQACCSYCSLRPSPSFGREKVDILSQS